MRRPHSILAMLNSSFAASAPNAFDPSPGNRTRAPGRRTAPGYTGVLKAGEVLGEMARNAKSQRVQKRRSSRSVSEAASRPWTC